MRKALCFMIALGALALAAVPALAEPFRELGGTYSPGDIGKACDKAGGSFTYIDEGNYGCRKGNNHVVCGQGKCIGCAQCNEKAARGSGKTGGHTVGGILTNANAQPLTPQRTTRPSTAAPTHPLTQQKVTRSPKTAQPLTAQKTTGAAGTNATQSKTAPSQRRNVH